ncbi:Uncharacterised protein [Vibrio cholerae]|nr:Uncharacterised protein [Vibrio cholerae]
MSYCFEDVHRYGWNICNLTIKYQRVKFVFLTKFAIHLVALIMMY